MFRLNFHHQGADTYYLETYINKILVCYAVKKNTGNIRKTEHINPLSITLVKLLGTLCLCPNSNFGNI